MCHQNVEWTPPKVLLGGREETPFSLCLPLMFYQFIYFCLLSSSLVASLTLKKLLSLLRSFIILFYAKEVISHCLKKLVERTSIIILFCYTFLLIFFSVSFTLKTFPLCWLRKLVDFKLGCEKKNDDKDKNKIDRGDAYKVDIDNGIRKIKVCVMIPDGKRKKETWRKEGVRVVMEMHRNQG